MSEQDQIRVMIVDDHELARSGLRTMLIGEPRVEVIGEASNGREALDLCDQLKPDLVLMDVRMPDMDGLAATAMLKERFPAVSVIIVTMYENPDYLFQAIRAGAAGYLLKDATRTEIIEAIRRVVEGETLLSPEFAGQVLRRISQELTRDLNGSPERLTPRESDVMQLIAQGMTNRAIADTLSISPGTVKIHVERIIAKLGVSDRTQAAVRAVQLGLVSSPL
jgi:DNA-binding NarL/FixJ family response regulator